MALLNATGRISNDRRLSSLIEKLLDELLAISGCSHALFVRSDPDLHSFALASLTDKSVKLDWVELSKLAWEYGQSQTGFSVGRFEDFGSSDIFERIRSVLYLAPFDVFGSAPLVFEEVLVGMAILAGSSRDIDLETLHDDKPRIESLAAFAAGAIFAVFQSNLRRSNHEVHEEALRGLPEGLLIADEHGVVLESNEAFARLTGIAGESILGRDLLQQNLLTSDCDYLVARLLETGQPFDVIAPIGVCPEENSDILNLEESSDSRFLRLRGTSYASGTGPRGGMVLLAEDVTDDVRAKRESNRRERRYSQEIDLAKRLQQDFFPANYQKKRIKINTRLILAAELAGDFFDIFNLGPNIIGIVMGDVVGKGIPGSLMAMSAHGMIANQAGALTPPMKVLERVSDALNHQVKSDYWYATCIYAKIHVTQLRITYSRAGFELPLWWHHDSNEVTFLEGEGLPLGIFPGNQYSTHQVTLNEGDRLLLYTDGLTDTVNPAGERFGHDRLVDLFKRYSSLSSKNLLNLIENTVNEFRGRRELLDDIALALISVVPDSWTTLTIPPYSFSEILEGLINELSLKGVDEETIFKIRLSMDECVTNAYRHGHRYDERKPITVGYLVEPGRVTVKVRDSGQGFDFGLIPDPTLEENLMSPGGRGVFLTLKMMDEVTFNDVGNEITLIKYLHVEGNGSRAPRV